MTEPLDSRVQGVEIGALADALPAAPFPLECAELLERHGSVTIGYPNGSAELQEVLAPFEVTVHSPEELQSLILAGVGMDAVGRSRYTDRGGAATAVHSTWHGDTI